MSGQKKKLLIILSACIAAVLIIIILISMMWPLIGDKIVAKPGVLRTIESDCNGEMTVYNWSTNVNKKGLIGLLILGKHVCSDGDMDYYRWSLDPAGKTGVLLVIWKGMYSFDSDVPGLPGNPLFNDPENIQIFRAQTP